MARKRQFRKASVVYFGLEVVLLCLCSTPVFADGEYWTTFTIPKAPDCINKICLPSAVGQVTIIEESTSEQLADCEFDSGDYVVAPSPAGGSWFACRRTFDPVTKNTVVKIYSKQANLPILHVFHRITAGNAKGGIWQESLAQSSDQVVHTPDGGAIPDPYDYRGFEFAGHKVFFLMAPDEGFNAVRAAADAFKEAGYNAVLRRYENEIGEVDVYDTLDGRGKIGDVLSDKEWVALADKSSTRGNKGTFRRPRIFVGTPFGITLISEHYFHDEQPTSGFVGVVSETGGVLTNATVTINGERLPVKQGGFSGCDISGLDIRPGQKLFLEVTLPNRSKPIKLEFSCPQVFEILSPEEGSLINDGPLKVQWSRPLPAGQSSSSGMAPVAGQYACNAGSAGFTRFGRGDWYKQLTVGQTEVTLDSVDTTCEKSYIEVWAAGVPFQDGKGNYASCSLIRRVKQVK